MLKPTELGLTGKERMISSHRDLIKQKVSNLRKPVARTCLDLLNARSGNKVDVSGLTSTDFNEIKNYFAECAGPVWVATYSLIPNVNQGDKTYFSNSATERLYDFKIIKQNQDILVSNKQAKGGTNTLKPGDVVSLVNKDPTLKEKWARTKPYKTFEILDVSNVISGPLKAVRTLYPNLAPLTSAEMDRILMQMKANDVKIQDPPKKLLEMIKKDYAAKEHYLQEKTVTGTMVNYLFEKILIEVSASDSKYNDLFVDVTANNVHFLKFDLSNTGNVYYAIINPRNANRKAKLRSKQGVERRGSSGRLKLDKLGFQP